MKLSTKGEYAVRALLELALEQPGACLTAHELAQRTSTDPQYLGTPLGRLGSVGLLRARRGQRGGFELARPADRISMAEVVRVMDGSLAPAPCASRSAFASCPAERCPEPDQCALRSVWIEVHDAINAVLVSTTGRPRAQRTNGPGRPGSRALVGKTAAKARALPRRGRTERWAASRGLPPTVRPSTFANAVVAASAQPRRSKKVHHSRRLRSVSLSCEVCCRVQRGDERHERSRRSHGSKS
jgi:Rrf2 family protein